MSSIVTIAGSPSFPSKSAAILDYVGQVVGERGFTTHHIIVRDLDAQALLWGKYDSPNLAPAREALENASGVVVATPVYKAAYTGVLKTFLDILPQNALTGKVVLPIVTGGSLAHSLVLDYALKPVLSALGSETILTGVYLIDNQLEHNDGTHLRFLHEDAERRLLNAVDGLVNVLIEQRDRPKEKVS